MSDIFGAVINEEKFNFAGYGNKDENVYYERWPILEKATKISMFNIKGEGTHVGINYLGP